MLSTDHKIYSFPLFSITLFVIGISLIIGSVINIFSLEDYSRNQTITKPKFAHFIHEDSSIFDFSDKKNKKFVPKFIVRNDLSIKGLIVKSTLSKKNDNNIQSGDDSIILNNFDIETVSLNKEISALNLQTLPNILNLIDVNEKKEKFIISILPYVVLENEKIRANREKLLKIYNFLVVHKTLNKNDQSFLELLASKYNIEIHNKHKIDIIEALIKSVDVIPNSIVIAQAANESGWGTSRFAKEFNALFGEYTFDTKNGVAPASRNDGEKHLIKFFPTINESVRSYFNNLNTHSAYKEFRTTRNQLRKLNLKLDPMILVKDLKPYAKDTNYVKTIKSIIETNKLDQLDSLAIITTKS